MPMAYKQVFFGNLELGESMLGSRKYGLGMSLTLVNLQFSTFLEANCATSLRGGVS